jgi:hypothetical protein
MESASTIEEIGRTEVHLPPLESLSDLEARMLWPRNDTARKQFVESRRADFVCGVFNIYPIVQRVSIGGSQQIVVMSAEDQGSEIASLARRSMPWPMIEDAAKEVFLDGYISGLILRMTLARVGGASEKRASIQAVMREIAGNYRAQKIGFETIRDRIWRDYRGVSHYWAAFQDAVAKDGARAEFPFALHEFYAWLAAAERYRELGERTRTFRARTPILREGDAFIFRNCVAH